MTGISLIIANARSTNALPRDTMLTLAEAHPQLSNFVNACAERERDAATPADRPVSQDGFRMALAAAYQRGKRAAPPPQAPATRPSNTTTQDQSTPQRVNPLLRRAMDKATTSKPSTTPACQSTHVADTDQEHADEDDAIDAVEAEFAHLFAMMADTSHTNDGSCAIDPMYTVPHGNHVRMPGADTMCAYTMTGERRLCTNFRPLKAPAHFMSAHGPFQSTEIADLHIDFEHHETGELVPIVIPDVYVIGDPRVFILGILDMKDDTKPQRGMDMTYPHVQDARRRVQERR